MLTDENLSPKEYLNVIRLYLRNLINDHKPIMESNNNNNDNKNTNTNTNTNRAEWKVLLMDSDTENIIDTLFNTILSRIQEAMETSNERESGFTHESVGLLYYHFKE